MSKKCLATFKQGSLVGKASLRKNMIIDDLSHINRYSTIHPLFKEAFEFILSKQALSLSPGKIYLKEERLIAIVEARPGITRQEAVLEAHKNYVDIQYTLSGQEEIGWR